jgi:hypothetical protein
MYGTTDLCPCCKDTTETMSHVFSCPAPEANQARIELRAQRETTLKQINTPIKILQAIIHGLQEWETNMHTPTATFKAPFRGSVLPADCTLVQAYQEQSKEIGWDHFLRGRISTKWSRAYQLYLYKPDQELPKTTPWVKQVITAIWHYSSSIWKFCNGIKYGHTKEEAIEKELADLHHQVSNEYALYTKDPFIISSQYRYLFDNKDLQDRK